MKRILAFMALSLLRPILRAEKPKELLNVPYGRHPRQVLDFYQAKSDQPTPVVFYIHGGGWRNGDKKMNPKPFLDDGISVVAINYRFVQHGVEENVVPPVKAPLEDAARALQFVRSKAGEWNIDKKRIGATGGSAGGCCRNSPRPCADAVRGKQSAHGFSSREKRRGRDSNPR